MAHADTRKGNTRFVFVPGDGAVLVLHFGFTDARQNWPMWYWSSTARGDAAQQLIKTYNLTKDNPVWEGN